MNLTSVTMAHLAKLEPGARRAKLSGLVAPNLAALARQIAWVGARPPIERLLRMASNVLPGYTHPIAQALYAEPEMAALVERRLAEAGALARRLGVRLSFHPGPFCLLASRNPAAIANGLSELDYHAEIFDRMGYGGGWHPHGAHINIHVGAGDPGVEGFRETLPRASRVARDLVTVENDENVFGLDAVLRLADLVPVVLDLHHHWVQSGGEYLEPDDPRIAQVRESWRGVRPVAHISVSREAVSAECDPDALPDFLALRAAGHAVRALGPFGHDVEPGGKRSGRPPSRLGGFRDRGQGEEPRLDADRPPHRRPGAGGPDRRRMTGRSRRCPRTALGILP